MYRALFRFGREIWCRLGHRLGGYRPRADFDHYRCSNVREHLGQGIPIAVVCAVLVVVAGVVKNRGLAGEDGDDVTGYFGDITAVIDRRAAIDPWAGGHDCVISIVVDALVDGDRMLGFAVLPSHTHLDAGGGLGPCVNGGHQAVRETFFVAQHEQLGRTLIAQDLEREIEVGGVDGGTQQRFVDLALLVDDHEFQQALAHVDDGRKTNLTVLPVQFDVPDLEAIRVELDDY